jgi:carbamate kinase
VAAWALAAVARDHELIVTDGNGPQVGLLALQAAASQAVTPFDVLGAESDGMIGYVLAQELGTTVRTGPGHRSHRRRARPVASRVASVVSTGATRDAPG